jgi:hypothetical protein
MFGVVIVSMVVLAVLTLFEMPKLESKAFTIIKKLTFKSEMKKQAALIIQNALRLHLKMRKQRPLQTKKVFHLKNLIEEFRWNLR